MKPGKTLMPILLGLLAGIIALGILKFFTPFLELAVLDESGIQGSKEIEEFLHKSPVMNLAHVITWTLIVFISSYTASWKASEMRNAAGLVAGGVFFIIFLSNPDFLRNQFTYYLVFVATGLAALALPSLLLRKQ